MIHRHGDLSATPGHRSPIATLFKSNQSTGDNSGLKKRSNPLSVREHEVLQWLLGGKSNWDIGMILSISEFTVKNHVQSILRKLNANGRQHAVAKALEAGLIQL
jgi:DNA-binding CsgD family transcriptional regulator